MATRTDAENLQIILDGYNAVKKQRDDALTAASAAQAALAAAQNAGSNVPAALETAIQGLVTEVATDNPAVVAADDAAAAAASAPSPEAAGS